MMCYERCCRLCLKDLVGPGIDCTSITEIQDAINVLFDVKISRTDTTRCICNKCFENVMSFKAFKKTVAECQTIIQDYENIKRKILECRTLSIKEEIIDLSDTEASALNKLKRKRPITNPVTDSQINDILDMVHDSSTSKNSLKTNSTNLNKKLKSTITSPASSLPVTIKKEPNTSSTPPPTSANDSRIAKPAVPASPLLKTVPNKMTPSSSDSTAKNDKRCDSLCSTSTSGIGSSVDASKVIIKKEPGTTECDTSQKKDTNTEAVSSSVPTPAEEQQTNDSQKEPTRTSTPVGKKNEDNVKSTTDKPADGINNNNTIEKEQNKSVVNKNSPEKPNESPKQNGVESKFHCSLCTVHFKVPKDYENHMKKHKSIKVEHEKSQAPKNKHVKNIKEESSVSSSEEEIRVPMTRGRSSRQAKTQALKKIQATPPKRRYSSSPAVAKKTKVGRKLNNTVDSTTLPSETKKPVKVPEKKEKTEKTETTEKTEKTDKTEKTEKTETTEKTEKKENLPVPAQVHLKPTTHRQKKRVITITLLRTKESVNFKYCDQFKNVIEYETISPEELHDIRSSLMIPEIWNNLTNVFKTSPPDENTIDQLKFIFGDKFRL